jgi:hypothetical protein
MMPDIDRRDFLRVSAAISLSAAVPADLFSQAAKAGGPSAEWDAGPVRLLLPGCERQPNADQGILRCAAEQRADVAS